MRNNFRSLPVACALLFHHIHVRIGDDGIQWIPWAHLLEFHGGKSNGLFLSWHLGRISLSHPFACLALIVIVTSLLVACPALLIYAGSAAPFCGGCLSRFCIAQGTRWLCRFQYTFAGLAAYLVYEYAPTARGSGIPEADLGFSPVL